VRGNLQARFGGGPTEKDHSRGTSLAAYPTLREPRGETPLGYSPRPRNLVRLALTEAVERRFG